MFKLGRQKPRKCKYVSGFGENAQRCDELVDPERGEGSIMCWFHKEDEERTADNHPGKVGNE